MKKIRYSSPEASTDTFGLSCSLLSESSSASASSNIEDFVDNEDLISW